MLSVNYCSVLYPSQNNQPCSSKSKDAITALYLSLTFLVGFLLLLVTYALIYLLGLFKTIHVLTTLLVFLVILLVIVPYVRRMERHKGKSRE